MNDQVDQIELAGQLIDAVWLRDACHCHLCRDPHTNQRILDHRDLALNLTVGSFSVHDGVLRAHFSDGHLGLIPWDMLEAYRRMRQRVDDSPFPSDRHLGPVGNISHYTFDWFMGDFKNITESCVAVWKDGAVVLHGIEPTGYALRWVAELLGNLYGTIHGDVWEADTAGDPQRRVPPDVPVLVHTDLPYTLHPPGVVMYLCIGLPERGGEMHLVDGFAIAEMVRHESPELFELLTSVPLAYHHHRDPVVLSAASPVVSLDAANIYSMVRHAPNLAGSPQLKPEQSRDTYRVLARWRDLVESSVHHDVIGLEPGDLLIIDNHRMMHGRGAFVDSHENRRSMLGCYLASDGIKSRVAMANLGYAFSSEPPGFVESRRNDVGGKDLCGEKPHHAD